MAQTLGRDKARARISNAMPLDFPFVSNILRQGQRSFNLTPNSTSYYEMLCSTGIKKGE